MQKKRFSKEGWEDIVPAFVRNDQQYYRLRVNPVEVEDAIIATEVTLDHYPTDDDRQEIYNQLLQEAIQLKKLQIDEYSKSAKVKNYFINGVAGWEDSDARTSISKAASNKASMGRTSYTLYHGGVGFTSSPSEVVMLLAKVEVYASDCYDVTEQTKHIVETLLNIQEVEQFDFTKSYPEVLSLKL